MNSSEQNESSKSSYHTVDNAEAPCYLQVRELLWNTGFSLEVETKNGERGILIPIKDVNAMTTSLLTMIEDKELANHYGEKGLEVIEDLQESKISRMWENAFHYIINKQLS